MYDLCDIPLEPTFYQEPVVYYEEISDYQEPFDYEEGFFLLTDLTTSVLLTGIVVLFVILVISLEEGSSSTWYRQLILPHLHPYYLTVLLIFSLLLQYIVVIIDPRLHLNFVLALLFVSTAFLLLWSLAFFQGENIGLAAWASVPFLIFQFGLFFYFYYRDWVSSVLILFSIGFAIYLFYLMAHIASINDTIV